RPGRLDFILKFTIPDREERLEIFRISTKGRPMNSDVDLEELAGRTEGLVGSHIAFICKRAVMLAIAEMIHLRRAKAHGKLSVSAAHFRAALEELRECEAPRTHDGVVQVLRFHKNE
ncbi:MAG: hypothetical protein KKF01_05960, partial [Proteobacteria bacterium]|nr:hypothetical protein [Pseudomonadota bacterium]